MCVEASGWEPWDARDRHRSWMPNGTAAAPARLARLALPCHGPEYQDRLVPECLQIIAMRAAQS
jgi:hypothetical protein